MGFTRQAHHVVLGLISFHGLAMAHEHHTDQIPENSVISEDPIDAILWSHICLMTLSFGILFPIGIVLGITKSRLHVPTQIAAIALATFGVTLAHKHKGRQFTSNIHANFAPVVILYVIIQVVLGAYLRLHLSKGINKYIRRVAVIAHSIMGKALPIIAWVQMGFGGIVALGFCRNDPGDHLGQCLAHGIMGSSFVAYGIVMLIMLQLGQPWLKTIGKSQEFLDSSVIMVWGIVNTFTEHRWGTNWSHGDMQHTSMGLLWWCAGLAGVFLSSKEGQPRRNVVPAAIIFLTGWAMSGHAQHLMISTKVHETFGYTLMAAGLTRILEVAVILRDQDSDTDGIRSFQYIPPFLLIASGIIFMAANEEQLVLIDSTEMDHVSYGLILFSIAFLIFFFANFLITLYQSSFKGASGFKGGSLENGNGYMPASTGAGHIDAIREFDLGTEDEDEDEQLEANRYKPK